MWAVYQIKNNVTGDSYIGATSNIERRFNEHKSNSNIIRERPLYNSIREHGIENFSFIILESIDVHERAHLMNREIYWVAKLKPTFNRNIGGLGNNGYKPSESTKQKLSSIAKKQWEDKTEQEKLAIIKNNLKPAQVGHPVSEETRRKLRLANLGKKAPDEVKKKISDSLKGKPRENLHHYKRIACYKEGVLIEKFNSVKSAAEKYHARPEAISVVLKGRRKRFREMEWKYITD